MKHYALVSGKYHRSTGAKTYGTTVYGSKTKEQVVEESISGFKHMYPRSTPVKVSVREDGENVSTDFTF